MRHESPHGLERFKSIPSTGSNVHLMAPDRRAEVRAQLQSVRRVKRGLAGAVAGLLCMGSLGAGLEHRPAKVRSYTAIELDAPRAKSTTTVTLPPTTAKPRAEATTLPPTTLKKAPPTTVPPTTVPPKPVQAAALPISPPNLQVIQYDVAWPQCRAAEYDPDPLPPSPASVVQITGGQEDKLSPCLVQEAKHNGQASMFYFMAGARGPNPRQYLYGYMQQAIRSMEGNSLSGGVWLDIEMSENDQHQELWTSDTNTNVQAIEGAVQALDEAAQSTGNRIYFAGIYSNKRFMREIVGNWLPDAPMWYATGQSKQSDALSYCGRPDLAFASGSHSTWALVQYQPTDQLDMDVACPATGH